MSRYSFRRLSALLPKSKLAAVPTSASPSIQNLAELVWASCAPDLAKHTEILVQPAGQILIRTASSAWAHKVFHQQTQIKKSLLAAGISVAVIRIRVTQQLSESRHLDYNRERVRPKAIPLSNNSANQLKDLANSVSNEHLRESLLRLSRRTKKLP